MGLGLLGLMETDRATACVVCQKVEDPKLNNSRWMPMDAKS